MSVPRFRSSAPGRRRAETPKRFAMPRALKLTSALAVLALVAGSITAGIVFAPSAQAGDGPIVTLGASAAPKGVLAGENETLTLTVANQPGTMDWYNMAVVVTLPAGVEILSSPGLGTPKEYKSGVQLPNGGIVPPGVSVWVWQDISDLPKGASRSFDIEVSLAQPDKGTGETDVTTVFPVGSTMTSTATAYASEEARYLPIFPGSTGKGGASAIAKTVSGNVPTADTLVNAIRVTKSEPSPENELLRGVHDHTTEFTISVENTSQGPTADTQLVDYIPAGLEFLGCGQIDNTRNAAPEYDLRDLTGTPVVDPCIAAASVETVERTADNADTFPEGLANGVYTKVTWDLGTLAEGEKRDIVYRAGIPMQMNTMDFSGADGAGLDAATWQGANLDNNNGASTRQGDGTTTPVDGQVYTNTAAANGTYEGVVRTGTNPAVSDHDTESVDSMDLRVLKSVDTTPAAAGVSTEFFAGRIAKYTLNVATSEYASAAEITLTDVIPDGLCPILPAGFTVDLDQSDPFPVDCAFDDAPSGVSISGAEVTGASYDAANGVFTVQFTIAEPGLTANDEVEIVYPVLMRTNYVGGGGRTGSLDSFTNNVKIVGVTTGLHGDEANKIEHVTDDSSATIAAGGTMISKTVLERDALVAGDDCPATSASYIKNSPTNDPKLRFVLGDTVCYQLTVDFALDAETRNPIITDIMPDGITFVEQNARLVDRAGQAISGVTLDPGYTDGGSVQTWMPLTHRAIPGNTASDRLVPQGSTIVITLVGVVTSVSEPGSLDKPENLMKYRQNNIKGEVFFDRDQAVTTVEAGLQLKKGVQDVDTESTRAAASETLADGADFNSNRDGIQVVEGEEVTYRIDLSQAPQNVHDLTVTDRLPDGITEADVETPALPAGVAVSYEVRADGRTYMTWTGLEVAKLTDTTLLYTVTIPAETSVSTSLTNTASITSYKFETNNGDDPLVVPGAEGVPTTGTSDDSEVHLPPATMAKRVVATEVDGTNNNGVGSPIAPATVPQPQAVHGEFITYEYSVTIPGRTSVKNAVLKDSGWLSNNAGLNSKKPYTVKAGSATKSYNGTGTVDLSLFTLSADGKLTFPALYDNVTDDPETFTVQITVYSIEKWTNNNTLRNQATFTADGTTLDAIATVNYIVPNPQIVKTVDVPATEAIASGDIAGYTLTATNPTGRPTSFDTVVTDCVPAELVVAPLAPPRGDVVITTNACGSETPATGTKIVWTIGELVAGTPQTLAYSAQVSPAAAGGAVYVNNVGLVGYALDTVPTGQEARQLELTDTDEAQVTIVNASTTKTVDRPTSVIGDTVTYEVVTVLPADANFYDAKLRDVFPAGIELDGNAAFTCVDSEGDVCDSPVSWGAPDFDEATGITSWSVLDAGGDIATWPYERTLTVTYDAILTNDIVRPASGVTLNNTAYFTWNTKNGDDTTEIPTEEGTGPVTVLEPVLTIKKYVEGADAQDDETAYAAVPESTLNYALEITNPGGEFGATAYDVIVVDRIPALLGDVTVVETPTPLPAGVSYVITSDADTGETILTWTIEEIPETVADAPLRLPYTATLAPSAALDGSTLTNTAAITEFWSMPEGNDDRREYEGNADPAVIVPAFPEITVEKATVSGVTAQVGTAFPWAITITNTGNGVAESVTASDTLPIGWDTPSVTAVTRNGVAVPEADWGFASTALVWTFADVEPSDVIVVTLNTTPRAAAYINPPAAGVGANPAGPSNPHRNLVAITAATDGTGSSTHLGPDGEQLPYAGDEDEAEAFLRATDLSIVKTLVPVKAPATKVWAGDTVEFLLTVTNNGPQSADVVTITDTLPTGLTFVGVTIPGAGETGVWNTCTVTGETLTCQLTSSLAAGATASVRVKAIAKAPAAGDLSVTRTNPASVTTTTPETNPSNNSDTEDVTIWAKPSIEIVKSADERAGHAATDGVDDDTQYVLDAQTPARTAHFSITVTNNGPVALQNIVVTDPLAALCANAAVPNLAPGESHTYQCDGPAPSASGYTNTAAVTGQTSEGDPASDTDTSRVELSAIQLEKTGSLASSDPSTVGDVITYTFTVTNTGSSTLTDVSLSDELEGISAIDYDWSTAATEGSLEPGEAITATATYALTLADVNAKKVDNTATVVGTDPAGQEPTDEDSTTVTSESRPSISLVKTGSYDDEPADTLPEGKAGDLITYTFTAENTGNVTLHDVEISDPLTGLSALDYDWSLAAGVGILNPGQTVTATATYELTQADIDAGLRENTASVVGISPLEVSVDDDDSWTVIITPQPLIELEKDAALADGSTGRAGDTVEYTFTATNTGSVTLTGVTIEDPMTDLSVLTFDWSEASGENVLAPGESVTATASYTLTQADVDSGSVYNAASTEGTPPTGPAVDDDDDKTLPIDSTPSIEVVKTGVLASGATGLVGEVVEYTFVSTNTGNVTLSDVSIDDVSLPGLSALTYGAWPDAAAAGVLLPGESITATASYTLVQADIELGYVDNVATTEGTAPTTPAFPDGEVVTDDDPERVTTLQTPEITLEKTAAFAAGQLGAVGDTVEYGFTAVNTGNVTLTDVKIDDALKGLSKIAHVWPGKAGVLLPGQTVTATATYTVTQSDVDAGEIVNYASVAGTPPSGTPVTAEDDAVVTTPQAPAIDLVKDAALAAGATGVAGDTVKYSFTVTNTGDVSLHGVQITDPMEGLSAVTFGDWPKTAGTLLPGESVGASAEYVLTQADVDAGIVNNVATTSGTPQVGPAVTDEDPASVETLVEPSIELVKTGEFAGGAGGVVGGSIEYGFTVTNTGTVTLHDVAISDQLEGLSEITFGAWPATVGTLLPGESVTATASLLLTQAHIDAGAIDNSATATGVPPVGGAVESVTDTDDVTLTVTPTPAISIEKSGSLLASATGVVGDGVQFVMVATNTGNVTLHNVTVSDPMPGLSALKYGAWPAEAGVLAPGESVTVTADYTLTAADVAAGTVKNIASVTGESTPPDGGDGVTVGSESTATVTVPASGLGKTGIEAGAMIGTAALVLGLGAVLLLVGRRRRASRREAE